MSYSKMEAAMTQSQYENTPSSTAAQEQHSEARSAETSTTVVLDERFPPADQARTTTSTEQEHIEEFSKRSLSSSSVSKRGRLRDLVKLYGRSKEQQTILGVYEKILESRNNKFASTPTLIVVSGQPGVGKTALAREIKDIVQQRDGGFFVHWKFEQLNRLEAGEGFDDAFFDLCHQIKASDSCKAIRDALRAAGPADCAILLHMIPSLELIIGGKEFEGHAKRGAETSGRHMHVIKHFFQSIGAYGQLVMLFDDLQFSDPCSLTMISKLISDRNASGVMYMATVGPNENERLDKIMTTFAQGQVDITQITLKELSEETVNMMVADMLHVDSNESIPMTQFLYRHTKGNTLFVVELLRLMYRKGVLVYNKESTSWDCIETKMNYVYQCKDFESIHAKEMAQSSEELQAMLKTASCIGSRIDGKVLEMVMGLSLTNELKTADNMGLVVCISQKNKVYRFAHSSVRNGAYALISKEQKESFHLDIGRKMWKQLSSEDLYIHISIVLSQIKIGGNAVKDLEERRQLARLYVNGAERALEWFGFHVAVECLELGLQMLGETCWREEYDLTLTIHNSCAEVCYTVGAFARVEELVDAVLRNARVFEHKIQAYCSRLHVYSAVDRAQEAIETGLDVLERLGESFQRNPNSRTVLCAFARMQVSMRNKTPEMILRLPRMTDANKVACMQLLSIIIGPAYMVRPNLVTLLVLRGLRISLDHGLCAISAMLFAVYGMTLSGYGKQIEQGTRFGELALTLLKEFDAIQWMPRVHVCVYGCIHGWTHSLRECIAPLEQGMMTGLETGDNEFASLNGHIRCVYLFALGEPLPTLQKEIGFFFQEMRALGQETMMQIASPFRDMIGALTGGIDGYRAFVESSVANESAYVKHQALGTFWGSWLSYQKSFIAYVFTDFEFAAIQAKQSRGMDTLPFISIDDAQSQLMDALIHIALYKKLRTHKRQTLRLARSRLKSLEMLARYNPQFCLGKVHLIRAQIAELTSHHTEAYQHYVLGCCVLDSEGLLMEHAMAKELAGKYTLERGKKGLAKEYLAESVDLFEQWGAMGKASMLKTENRLLLGTQNGEERNKHIM